MISDFSEEVVRSFLKCIYDQSLVETELKIHAEQLLAIANKYEISFLLECATTHIIQSLSVDNALDILLFAHKYDKIEIKKEAMSLMVQNSCFFLTRADLIEKMGPDLLYEFNCFMAANYSFEPTAKKQKIGI